MRIKEQQIRQICQKILVTLRSQQLIKFTKPEGEALARMEAIFIADLKVEEQVDREAEKILAQYAAKMGGSIDREKMFQMIKKQLIKDKNIVI